MRMFAQERLCGRFNKTCMTGLLQLPPIAKFLVHFIQNTYTRVLITRGVSRACCGTYRTHNTVRRSAPGSNP